MTNGGPAASARPESDVSAGVGLAGLCGLFVWIGICRGWPGIAVALDLPGPREVLSGPYAALATILFTGLPMVVWSIAVDEVHLRPSTGIDWKRPRCARAAFDVSVTKLAGLWATWAVIGFLYCVGRWYWEGQYLFAMEVLGIAAVPLFLCSIPYVLWLDRYLVEPRDGAWHFGAMLLGREAFDPGEVNAHVRAWAVKGFFCAFMLSILPFGFAGVVELDIATLVGDPVALCRWLIELLFVIDVQIAMVGYLLTMKPLDAHIRSANPYVSGWVAALICYPPFILMADGGPLSYHPNTAEWSYWFDGHPLLLALWGSWLVVLAAIYAWATVIFGLRFSNLTYRGIVTNGPYRLTRHPAYLSKNLFWWFSSLPFLATSHSLVDMVRNATLMALVSLVYYWRAKTEEAHLLAEDVKYREYHAWMGRHAPLTRALARLGGSWRSRATGQPQPAE